eukprot:scaffold14973_cov155-Isochrysis_galbana.AAC.3
MTLAGVKKKTVRQAGNVKTKLVSLARTPARGSQALLIAEAFGVALWLTYHVALRWVTRAFWRRRDSHDGVVRLRQRPKERRARGRAFHANPKIGLTCCWRKCAGPLGVSRASMGGRDGGGRTRRRGVDRLLFTELRGCGWGLCALWAVWGGGSCSCVCAYDRVLLLRLCHK